MGARKMPHKVRATPPGQSVFRWEVSRIGNQHPQLRAVRRAQFGEKSLHIRHKSRAATRFSRHVGKV
jgi:hypothetical protein